MKDKHMNQPDREYFLRHKNPLEYITSAAVGFPAKIYWCDGAALRLDNPDYRLPDYYQIMPHSKVEAGRQDVSDFFDWHLRHNQQFFETPVEAAAAFVKAWESWPEKRIAK